jgi:hypothetical protein
MISIAAWGLSRRWRPIPTNHRSKNSSMVDASWRGEKPSATSLYLSIGDGNHGTTDSSTDFSWRIGVSAAFRGCEAMLTAAEHAVPSTQARVMLNATAQPC